MGTSYTPPCVLVQLTRRPSGQKGALKGHTDRSFELDLDPRELFYRYRKLIIETLCSKNLGVGLHGKKPLWAFSCAGNFEGSWTMRQLKQRWAYYFSFEGRKTGVLSECGRETTIPAFALNSNLN